MIPEIDFLAESARNFEAIFWENGFYSYYATTKYSSGRIIKY